MNIESEIISGHCFDGVSAAPQAAVLSINGTNVRLEYANTQLDEPINHVNFGQATQHGIRLISFNNGIQFQAHDVAALNHYLNLHHAGRSWIDQATSKWRYVAVCAAAVLALIIGFYLWGIPAVAKVGAPFVPQSVKDTLGENALKGMDKFAFKPSKTSLIQQNEIKARWQAALVKAFPKGDYPKHEVLFRQMNRFNLNTKTVNTQDDTEDGIGTRKDSSTSNADDAGIPNAMALPNGTIILTDALVKLLEDKPNAITGVLAHELGHINHHHSMRALIQVSSMALIQSAVLGDHTVWVNQLPLLVGQMAYSRDHESEADDEAIRVMKAANINPAELAIFFERVEKWGALADKPPSKLPQGSPQVPTQQTDASDPDKPKRWDVPDLLRSHPNSQSRMDKLRAAGQ